MDDVPQHAGRMEVSGGPAEVQRRSSGGRRRRRACGLEIMASMCVRKVGYCTAYFMKSTNKSRVVQEPLFWGFNHSERA